MNTNKPGSKEVTKAAIEMSMTDSRETEKEMQKQYHEKSIKTVAVDFGSDYIKAVMKIIERAVVSAKREGLIKECHLEEGAVAGATKEALTQIMQRAVGCNIGGKIGIARYNDHLSVSVFASVGLLHLNEIVIGVGHRAI